jgi:hypothetical protein
MVAYCIINMPRVGRTISMRGLSVPSVKQDVDHRQLVYSGSARDVPERKRADAQVDECVGRFPPAGWRAVGREDGGPRVSDQQQPARTARRVQSRA